MLVTHHSMSSSFICLVLAVLPFVLFSARHLPVLGEGPSAYSVADTSSLPPCNCYPLDHHKGHHLSSNMRTSLRSLPIFAIQLIVLAGQVRCHGGSHDQQASNDGDETYAAFHMRTEHHLDA